MIKYKIDTKSNIPILILERAKGAEETDTCPFCGTGHIHGTADGHRLAHCGSNGNGIKDSIVADDGTVLEQKYGYFIVTR